MNRRRAIRAYRLVVRLYPAAHRRAFGADMVQAFGDHYRDAVEGRGDSRLRFWLAVLADAGRSLLTEYAAEARTWRRRPRRRVEQAPQRHSSSVVAAVALQIDSGSRRRAKRRRVRVAPRLRYRRRNWVLIGTRRHQLVYRGRIRALIAGAVLTGVAFGTVTATGHLGIGVLLAGLSVLVALVRGVRLTRPVLAGPHGNGPTPPGGASVREPRRPLPICPAGSAARPAPDQDEPGQAIALI